MADVPHLQWPFAFDPGARTLAQVEQDSIEDVQQSVLSYLQTERGERSLSPDFGVDDPTFGPGVDAAQLSADIEASEDGRARVEITTVGVDARGRQQITVAVDLAE